MAVAPLVPLGRGFLSRVSQVKTGSIGSDGRTTNGTLANGHRLHYDHPAGEHGGQLASPSTLRAGAFFASRPRPGSTSSDGSWRRLSCAYWNAWLKPVSVLAGLSLPLLSDQGRH
jgi:hypothetical protein